MRMVRFKGSKIEKLSSRMGPLRNNIILHLLRCKPKRNKRQKSFKLEAITWKEEEGTLIQREAQPR
jgi:hypothetical protein